jgi:hypothetical protein
MRLKLALILLFICIQTQITTVDLQLHLSATATFTAATATSATSIATTTAISSTTTDVSDLQDGHPNHQLWQKVIDNEPSSNDDWYVKNKTNSLSHRFSFIADAHVIRVVAVQSN